MILVVVTAIIAGEYIPLVAGSWWIAVIVLRSVFTKTCRRGIRLVKAGEFSAAIPWFNAACEEFSRRPWLDRYRWVLLGTASRWTYREIALCNAAFCYGQIGDGVRMREGYEKALREFPESVLAATALRMMDTVSKSTPAK